MDTIREQAKKRLRAEPDRLARLTGCDREKVIHELGLHQIELELQNEELQASQRELEGLHQKYSALFNFAPVGYLSFDKKGVILDANHAAARLLGASKHSLAGIPFSVFVNGTEDLELFFRHTRDVLKQTASRSCEIRLKRRDNSTVNVRIESIRSDDKDQETIWSVVTDISDREEPALVHDHQTRSMRDGTAGPATPSLRLFRDLINQSNDALFVIDPDTSVFLDVNDQACRLLGYSREELLRLGVIDVDLNWSSLAPWRERVNSLQEQARTVETMSRRKDGTVFPCELSSKYITVDERRYIVTISRDITERKRAEESLRNNEKKIRDITSSIGEGLLVLNERCECIFMNAEAERLLGWTEAELANRNPHGVIHAANPAGEAVPADHCPLYTVIKTGARFVSDDQVFIRKDGTSFPASVVSSPLIQDGIVVASVTAFRDITDEKREKQARLQLIEELQRANTSIKKLHGVLPICSCCKKIRDDRGAWKRLEAYIVEHSEAKFSHGLCIDCAKKMYPDFYIEKQEGTGEDHLHGT